MPSSCPHAYQWLRLTFHQWLHPIQRGAPRHSPSHTASRHVSTTSAINRGLRAEADSKSQSPRSNFRDLSVARENPRAQEDGPRERWRDSVPERKRQLARKGFAQRGELLVRKHAGLDNPAYIQNHAIMADTLRTRRAKARNALTQAEYDEGSSQLGDEWVSERMARRRERAMWNLESTAVKGSGLESSTAEMLETDTQAFRSEVISRNQGTETAPKVRATRGQAKTLYLQSQAATKDSNTVERHSEPSGRVTFIDDGQNEETASSHNGHTAVTDRRKSFESIPKEDYEDLYPLLNTLQQAERTPGSDALALRDKSQSQLSEMIDKLNASFARIGDIVSTLRYVLGPHTTIDSQEAKEKDIYWTRHRTRPRAMPKSIIWFDRETGCVELVRPDRAISIQRAWLKQAKGPLATQNDQVEGNRGVLTSPVVISMRNTLAQCRLLLQRIQDVEKTVSPPEGVAQEESVDALVADLSRLITNLNKECIDKDEISHEDVRKALIAVLGLPGKYWTKAYPNVRRTMLLFDEASGNVSVVLPQRQDTETKDSAEPASGAPGKESDPQRKTQSEKDVQKVRDLLDRCRRFLETIQRVEQRDVVTATGTNTRPTLRLQEDKVVELVAQVNMLILNEHVEWPAVMFAVKRELGKQAKFWTSVPPNSTQTMIWVKEYARRLEVVRKDGSSSHSGEDAEVTRERWHHGDYPSTRRSSLHEPVASQPKLERQSERTVVPDRLRVQEGRSNYDTSSGRSKASGFDDEMPISIPHTTAASTFMYGSNAVLACLSAKKRKCYHLYISKPATKGDRDKKNLQQIEHLANAAHVPITTDANPALLDRMSMRRPHNGVVLETSQVSTPPVLGLGKPDLSLSMIPVKLDRQSAEDMTVNGAPTALPILTKTWRQPFILMLDGILDEGNLGNIIRTAYFYGVDAVAVSKNTCASVNSGIVSKASSGSIEAVQILSLPQPSKFVYNSLLASWRVYAAVAPSFDNRIPANEAKKYVTHASVAAASPLRDHPCILMLGAEGEGLRDNLKNRADYFVSIEQGERRSLPGGVLPGIGVDSMNVASAAGVLVESFLRKPTGAQPLGIGSALGF